MLAEHPCGSQALGARTRTLPARRIEAATEGRCRSATIEPLPAAPMRLLAILAGLAAAAAKPTARTKRKPGLLIVGLGGNNGATVLAGLHANNMKTNLGGRQETMHSGLYGLHHADAGHASERFGAL